MASRTDTIATRPVLQNALRAACLLAALVLPPAAAPAEDAAPEALRHVRPSVEELAVPQAPDAPRYVRPSVEELAIPQAAMQSDTDSGTREAICLMIESAARANGLPLEFFARVIWQESRFQSDVVGPRTRSGDRAEGIAQFMPGTARERGLLNPFNPVEALPKSAEFLAELRGRFGNLGLAAAAYNAGPQAVRDWLAGKRTLPGETQRYVLAITGTSVDEWAKGGKGAPPQPAPGCRQLMALLRRAPNPFVEQLEVRV